MSCSTNDDIRNSRYSEVCSIFVHYVFHAELASVQGAANKSVTFSESYDDFVLSSFPSEIFSTGRVLHRLASINSSRLNFLKMSTEDIQHATIVNFLCAAPSKDKKK